MSEKIPFDSEYILQHLTNDYLKILFGLEFITSEFQFKGIKINGSEFNDKIESLRIDGLAFDDKSKKFVIIEYKNEFNCNVLKQAKNYYYNLIESFDEGEFKEGGEEDLEEVYSCLLKKNREELYRLYEEKLEKDFKDEGKGLEARVLIIGPKFSKKQIEKSQDPNNPYELCTVSLYKNNEINGYVFYEGINVQNFDKKKLHVNLGNLKLTICTLLNDKSDEIKELYKCFESSLLDQFQDWDIKYLVDAVSIKAHDEYICLVKVKNSIKIEFYYDFEDETLTQENMKRIIGLINEVYKQKVNKNE